MAALIHAWPIPVPPVGTAARALASQNAPVGNYPALVPARARPPWQWYTNFHKLGQLTPYLPDHPSDRQADRDSNAAQIQWHILPLANAAGHSLEYFQRRFLELPPGHPVPTARGVIYRQRKDRLVYDHLLKNVVGGPGNSLVFDDMKTLYFFLIHCQRSNTVFLNARPFIKNIEVLDITSGTHVKQALQQLNYCTGLEQLTLHACDRCHEVRAGAGKWQAWKRFRVPNNLRMLTTANNAHLSISYRANWRPQPFCERCQDADATTANTLGGPTPSQQATYATNRLLALWNSMMS